MLSFGEAEVLARVPAYTCYQLGLHIARSKHIAYSNFGSIAQAQDIERHIMIY